MSWMGNQKSTAVGQASCAKKIARFKVDDISEQLQMAAQIFEFAREAANEATAGREVEQGECLDLTELMSKIADEKVKDEGEFQDPDQEEDFSFKLLAFELCRGTNDAEGAQVYRVSVTMESGFGSETAEESFKAETALLDLGDGTTRRTMACTGSFGGGKFAFELKGKIVSNTSDQILSLNLNVTNSDAGVAIVCSDPKNPDTCEQSKDVEFKHESTVALQQDYTQNSSAEWVDEGKIFWTEKGSGDGKGGASFNDKLRGGWDNTGAGCLELEHDFQSAVAKAGDAECGRYSSGTQQCEVYKAGQRFAQLKKIDDTKNTSFAGCDSKTGVCTGGFSCFDPTKTSNCDGFCPNGAKDLAAVPVGPPAFSAKDTLLIAWTGGCSDGSQFDKSKITNAADLAGKSRKGECWDSSGNVKTTTDDYNFEYGKRDARVNPMFQPGVNFDDSKDAVKFEKPANACVCTLDNNKHVELRNDGSEFCVPDHFKNDNKAKSDTPLCSEAPGLGIKACP